MLQIEISNLLKRFDALAKKFHGKCSDSILIPADNPLSPNFTLIVAIHGNEIGPLRQIVNCLEEYAENQSQRPVTIQCFLANRQAVLENNRFIEDDLNRVFSENAAMSFERRRAVEICDAIAGTDFLIDFHQTNQPLSQPFSI